MRGHRDELFVCFERGEDVHDEYFVYLEKANAR